MTVYEKPVGRGDFNLFRHGDNDIGVFWEEHDGTAYVPKNLSSWSAELTLKSEFGTPLLTLDCECTSDGWAMCTIPASVMESEDLADYTGGVWQIVGKNGTRTEVIGEGNFAIT